MRGRKFFTRIVVVAVIAVAAHIALLGDYSLLKIGSLYLEKEDLRTSLSSMEQEKDYLMEEQERIENDLFELERLARENVGMVKPGEKLFKAVIVGPRVQAGEEGEVEGQIDSSLSSR